MPQVGNKHFSYNKKGKEAAQKVAKKTGKKMMMKGKTMHTSDGFMKVKQL